eukprot:TRINITY_DN53370_c0_g1_i1.p1 TRINITY_DN53370_c0_g1~~TRINITY_DN53370_c0_g1_i1.p1  ORF type:complete len:699 (+),score=115.96 TRINITY_DN53370_c0_g1_i1:76-2172(+)
MAVATGLATVQSGTAGGLTAGSLAVESRAHGMRQQAALAAFLRTVAEGEEAVEEARCRLCETPNFDVYDAFVALQEYRQRPPRSTTAQKGWVDVADIQAFTSSLPHRMLGVHSDDAAALIAPYVNRAFELRYEGFLRMILPKDPRHNRLQELLLARGARVPPLPRSWQAGAVSSDAVPGLPTDVAVKLCHLFESEIDLCRHLKFHRKILAELNICQQTLVEILELPQPWESQGGSLAAATSAPTFVQPEALRELLVDKLRVLSPAHFAALVRRLNPSGACLLTMAELTEFIVAPSLPKPGDIAAAAAAATSAEATRAAFGATRSAWPAASAAIASSAWSGAHVDSPRGVAEAAPLAAPFVGPPGSPSPASSSMYRHSGYFTSAAPMSMPPQRAAAAAGAEATWHHSNEHVPPWEHSSFSAGVISPRASWSTFDPAAAASASSRQAKSFQAWSGRPADTSTRRGRMESPRASAAKLPRCSMCRDISLDLLDGRLRCSACEDKISALRDADLGDPLSRGGGRGMLRSASLSGLPTTASAYTFGVGSGGTSSASLAAAAARLTCAHSPEASPYSGAAASARRSSSLRRGAVASAAAFGAWERHEEQAPEWSPRQRAAYRMEREGLTDEAWIASLRHGIAGDGWAHSRSPSAQRRSSRPPFAQATQNARRLPRHVRFCAPADVAPAAAQASHWASASAPRVW